MKLVSWNVNGLRACLNKGFLEYFSHTDADFFCVQETKLQPHQIDLNPEGYQVYWNSAEKKGYSGTAIFAKHTPLSVAYGIGIRAHDQEGRVITLEYPDFYMVTVYTPNSQDELRRLDYRMTWEDAFADYLQTLDAKKPVVVCGDMNVAHTEIDLKNPKTNESNAGFTPQERAKMTALLSKGFVDTFRLLHPDDRDRYSWWSYRMNARDRNVGWRIDYFLVSKRIASQVLDADIEDQVLGSDHCPVTLELLLP
jgi:exodeoxyribonuclease III